MVWYHWDVSTGADDVSKWAGVVTDEKKESSGVGSIGEQARIIVAKAVSEGAGNLLYRRYVNTEAVKYWMDISAKQKQVVGVKLKEFHIKDGFKVDGLADFNNLTLDLSYCMELTMLPSSMGNVAAPPF